MKGYKVFNENWECRDFQYELGKTYEHKGEIKICKKGFHFCEDIKNCFDYYNFNPKNKVAEIDAIGEIETDNGKSVTSKITIIRQISWEEVLKLVNTGNGNTGINNAGDWNTGNKNTGNRNTGNENTGNSNTGNKNTGNRNTGNWNTGNWNTGNENTGNENTGNSNTGNENTGNWNTGNENTGNSNTGDQNTGNWNTGNENTGNWNTGNENTGNSNTGDQNTGNSNTGDQNTGNWNTGNSNTGNRNAGNSNTGDWNLSNYNTGYFNTLTPKIYLFDEPTDLYIEDIREIKGIRILNENYTNSQWVTENDMTDEEKKQYPSHTTTGGYLKTIPYKEACQLMWDKLTNAQKKEVMEIPNFNKEKFKEITGIKIGEV